MSTAIAAGQTDTKAAAASTPSTRPVFSSPSFVPGGTTNVYANATVGNLSSAVAGDPNLVYVPNSEGNTVDVIDPNTYKIISSFPVPRRPQHVVPSWDLQTLYVNSDLGNALTPIDPKTGRPGPTIPVDDPYNLYFTADGSKAIVVPEKLNALDFRDPHTFKLIKRVPLPCTFPNHMDFTGDGLSVVVTCEYSGTLVRVDTVKMTVTGKLEVGGSPQDIRLAPDGAVFYVADMDYGAVEIIDAIRLAPLGIINTGRGTHGLYPSRDATKLYVSNRLEGTVSVIDFATRKVTATWSLPGESPDMGGVSSDGTKLWLSGRYNKSVYVIDTTTGKYRIIKVGKGPHGLAVFPQPGRFSLGHTGDYR